jgi:transposase
MAKYKLAFVAFDSAKDKHAVAIAEDGRDGEVRYFGEFENSPDAVKKFVTKLSRGYDRLHFCYEAGPTGYGLHRQLTDLGHVCDVIAPTMIPKRTGDRVKTNRRDARSRRVNLGRTAQILCFLGPCTPPIPVEAPSLRSRGRPAERLPKRIAALRKL